MNVNIGLALVDGSSCSVHKGCIPVCVCVYVCVCAPSNPFYRICSSVPRAACQRTVFLRRGFIGFMQCIIRREGRGLCFDRVTAAGGGWGGRSLLLFHGACSVSQLQLTVTGPFSFTPPPDPVRRQSKQISMTLRAVVTS